MSSQAIKIKTFEVYKDRDYFDKQVNEWLEDNKEHIEVINISTSSRVASNVVYMATVVYKEG